MVPPPGSGQIPKGLQIKRPQGPLRLNLLERMGHHQSAIDQKNIGLTTVEPALQSVEKGIVLLIVIVGVGAPQWNGPMRPAGLPRLLLREGGAKNESCRGCPKESPGP